MLAFKGDSLNATSKLVKGAKEGGAVIFKSESPREWEGAAGIRAKGFHNFEFLDALRNKDYPKAVRIIKYFASNKSKNPTAPLIGLMFGFYSNLVIAHYLPDKSEAVIRQQFGFKAPAQLRGFMTAMRLYNPRQAVNAIHYLRDFDLRSKGRDSYFDEHDLLAELVFKLFT